MNRYKVRITNNAFCSATVWVNDVDAKAARKQALYGRTQFYVQWCKLVKRNIPHVQTGTTP
jgi:hypothetical protein